MSTFKERLIIEKQELDEKASKLENFINGEAFKSVDPIQKSLLSVQLSVMLSYSRVLQERLDNLND